MRYLQISKTQNLKQNSNIIIIKMGLKTVHKIISGFDMFPSTSFLRYKQNSNYSSVSNGLISILLTLIFAYILIQQIILVFDKSTISAKQTLINEANPSQMSIPLDLAISVYDYNLNDPAITYYDIFARVATFVPDKHYGTFTYRQFPLVACSIQDWKQKVPKQADLLDKLSFQNKVCFPSNQTLYLNGNGNSPQSVTRMSIIVKKCTNKYNTIPNRTCWTQNISNYFSVRVTLLSPIINLNNPDYLTYTLNTDYQYMYQDMMGKEARLLVSKYQIKTDESVWPWKTESSDLGYTLPKQPKLSFYQYVENGIVLDTIYYVFTFEKYTSEILYERSFYKILDALSYVGGLFTTIVAVFAILYRFNDNAFMLEAASSIFKHENNLKIRAKSFNLLTYFKYTLYELFFCCRQTQNQQKQFKAYEKTKEQFSKQLDVSLILQRITFLENCLKYLFEDYQLKCLHLRRKNDINEITQNRRMYQSKKLLLKMKRKKNEQKIQVKKEQDVNHDRNVNIKQIRSQIVLDSDDHFDSANHINNKDQLEIDNKQKQTNLKPAMEAISRALRYQDLRKKSSPKTLTNKNKIKQISSDKAHTNNELYHSPAKQVIIDTSNQSISSFEQSQNSFNDAQEKQFYKQMLNSIQQLENKAHFGSARCQRIYHDISKQMLIFETEEKNIEKNQKIIKKNISQNDS